ncbi:hypothetical protein BDV36DRAFT_290738 [Aspergillus pseudocaelatus]|uniref:Ricin B lectin domain-containing protein n=1 Tax=Aspergillus pseudocaelatus TaxID=1825620 RepID=A0ABQ6X0Q6_9EURO|nr:hypothetical protein BDV36DRAFT_290738 [Aspergillus pseudocaelatus]
MSDFTGPGTYTLAHVTLPRNDLMSMRAIQMIDPIDTGRERYEQQLLFAHLGGDEFFIISRKHGTYLTAARNQQLTAEVLPPVDGRIRWKLAPVRDGSGAFFIASLALPGHVIDVAWGFSDNENPIIIYPRKKEDSENQQFYLRAV